MPRAKPKLIEEPEAVIMRPSVFKKYLETLRISHRELAVMLGCTEPLPGLWAIGRRTVPPAVAAWLEACVKVRERHPYPNPPKGWRRPGRTAGPQRGAGGV